MRTSHAATARATLIGGVIRVGGTELFASGTCAMAFTNLEPATTYAMACELGLNH